MFRQQRFGDVNNTQSLVESNSSGQIFDRCQELSAIAGRLDEIDAQHGDSETPPPEFDELCLRRQQLVREIVDAPAPTIRESVLKTTVISSLLSDGELRLGLTRSCAADCERALGDEGEGDQSRNEQYGKGVAIVSSARQDRRDDHSGCRTGARKDPAFVPKTPAS